MKRRWLIIILGILGLLMVYEFFNNRFSIIMLAIGIGSLLLRNWASKKNQNSLFMIGIFAILFSLFSNRLVLAFIVVGLLLFIGENPEIYQLIRELLTNKKPLKNQNDFVMVDFEQSSNAPYKVSKNLWFGENRETEEEIYSWEDINFTKIFGNTVFDLGNTILPKETNIILIRKGIGKTKILVPEGVAISLNTSMLLGKVLIEEEEIDLKNETFHWYSDNYQTDARKVKVMANVLIGEIEVVFL